jgi:hypothetical protein
MRIGRIFVLLLLACALGAFGRDVYVFLDRGELGLAAIGQIWFELHANSLQLLEPAIVRHVHPLVWEWIAFPLVQQPAVLVFLVLAALVQIGRWRLARRRARREARFMLRPKQTQS